MPLLPRPVAVCAAVRLIEEAKPLAVLEGECCRLERGRAEERTRTFTPSTDATLASEDVDAIVQRIAKEAHELVACTPSTHIATAAHLVVAMARELSSDVIASEADVRRSARLKTQDEWETDDMIDAMHIYDPLWLN